MRAYSRAVACAVVVISSGCASTGQRTLGGAAAARWTAQLRQVEGTSASAVLTGRTNSTRGAYGDITVTTRDTLPPRSTVDINVSAPTIGSTQLAWAIFTGGCGAPTPSVVGVSEFPPLEITSGGARVRLDLNFALSPGLEYHVNVYNGSRASDVSNVMMCATLERSR